MPTKWTLPYFVISDKLFDNYVEDRNIENVTSKWTNGVNAAAVHCKISPEDQIIVRSNAHSEGLAERGKFISVEGTFQEWPKLVKQCFDDLIKQEGSKNVHMPVIIQKRVLALSRGHISNERRVAEENATGRGKLRKRFQEFSLFRCEVGAKR